MPIYRYQCSKCNAVFKVLHRNGECPPAVCPECGAENAERLLPRIGVIYRGKGYYSTDYRSKSAKADASAASSTASSSDD